MMRIDQRSGCSLRPSKTDDIAGPELHQPHPTVKAKRPGVVLGVVHCAVLVAVSFISFELPAQVFDTVAPEQVSPPPSLGVGNVNEALAEIERLRAELRTTDHRNEMHARLSRIEDQIHGEIDARLLAIPVERMDWRRLEWLKVAVARQRAELSRLGLDLNDVVAGVDTRREAFRAQVESWSAVRDETDGLGLPEEVVVLLDRVLEDGQGGQLDAAEQLGDLLLLQGRALSLTARLGSIASEADTRERTLLRELLRRDSRSMWSVVGEFRFAAVGNDLVYVWDSLRRAFIDLLSTYQNRVTVHILYGMVTLVVVLRIRRSPMLLESPQLEATHRALTHPIAATLILMMSVSRPLYPTAHPAVLTVCTVIFIGAALVVLGAVSQRLTTGLLWVAGCYLVIVRLSYLLPWDTPLSRLLLLVSALGGIVLLVVTWKILTSDANSRTARWRPAVALLMTALGFLLAAAILANLIGAVGFAVFVTDAVLRSYLAALGLLTITLIVRDLVRLVVRTTTLQRLRSVRVNAGLIETTVGNATVWLALILWLWAVLEVFRVVSPVTQAFRKVVGIELSVGELIFSPGSVLVFVFSVWIAVYASRITRFSLDQDVLPRLSLPRGVPSAVSTSVHYFLICGAVLFGLAAAGLDFSKVAIVLGALGVGVGFGLQNIVNNVFSGFILLFERPIQVGDNVLVGSLMGSVRRIGIRASIVRTYEGSEVIVPNGDLVSQQVINFTLSDRHRRLELIVGVAYQTDLDQAKSVMAEAVSSVPQVAPDPAPQVLFHRYADSSIDFRLLFWVEDFDLGLETISAVGFAINRALKQAGIEIPFPQRVLHFPDSPEKQS